MVGKLKEEMAGNGRGKGGKVAGNGENDGKRDGRGGKREEMGRNEGKRMGSGEERKEMEGNGGKMGHFDGKMAGNGERKWWEMAANESGKC